MKTPSNHCFKINTISPTADGINLFASIIIVVVFRESVTNSNGCFVGILKITERLLWTMAKYLRTKRKVLIIFVLGLQSICDGKFDGNARRSQSVFGSTFKGKHLVVAPGVDVSF